MVTHFEINCVIALRRLSQSDPWEVVGLLPKLIPFYSLFKSCLSFDGADVLTIIERSVTCPILEVS